MLQQILLAPHKAPNLVDSLENSLKASDPPPNIFINSAPRPPNISIANFVFIAPSSTLFKASATKPNKATWSFCIGKISAWVIPNFSKVTLASPTPSAKSPMLSVNLLTPFAKVSSSNPPICEASLNVCKSFVLIPKTPDNLPIRSVASKEFLLKFLDHQYQQLQLRLF